MRVRPDLRPFGKPSVSEVLVLWSPTLIGVAVALTMFVAVALAPGAAPTTDGAAPPRASIDMSWTPPPVADPVPPPVAATPSATGAAPAASPARRAAPTRPAATTRPLSPPRTTAPAPPPVTGRYRVLGSYQDSFIGEVLVTNASGTARNWTLRVRIPSSVGRLRTFWVESAPQATLQRSGGTYVFTSSVPVPARSSVPLRFHFDRWGHDNRPSACTVNGTGCRS